MSDTGYRQPQDRARANGVMWVLVVCAVLTATAASVYLYQQAAFAWAKGALREKRVRLKEAESEQRRREYEIERAGLTKGKTEFETRDAYAKDKQWSDARGRGIVIEAEIFDLFANYPGLR